MRSIRTGVKALAVLAGGALALSACASSSSGGSSSSQSNTTAPVTVTWAYEQEFTAYNNNTPDGNSSANTVVLNQVIPGFWYFGANGDVVPYKEFGTFEKTSDNPLTVKYTFNPKAAWSDGNPVDCDDAVLLWLANNGTTGKNGFKAASTAGYEDQNKPQCKDGDKTFTVVYKKPFADWQALYGGFMPAHIVEKNSGVPDIISAADTPTSPQIAKAAAFYNTAWQLNPGQLKPDIMPSSGPYTIASWQAGQSITLKANPKWWGTPPKAGTIVLRYLAGDAQAQALQNGEANIMDPQPQQDTVNQLRALGNKVKFSTQDQFSFEHIDYNFKTMFADRNLRLAFTKCIPRQQIVDNLIKPVNANAKIFQSRYVFPFQPDYSQFENSVGGNQYDSTDIPGAKKLVAASGKKNPITVRLAWRKDPAQLNQRRVDQLQLIQASCKQAGFNVVDAGTPTFFDKELPDGNYDVGMFAWAGSKLVTGSNGIYTTKGESNYGKYSNPKVDQLTAQLSSETDPAKQVGIEKQIDTQLWTDLVTVPLYAFPAVLATTPNVSGVTYNPSQADISFDAYNWTLKAS